MRLIIEFQYLFGFVFVVILHTLTVAVYTHYIHTYWQTDPSRTSFTPPPTHTHTYTHTNTHTHTQTHIHTQTHTHTQSTQVNPIFQEWSYGFLEFSTGLLVHLRTSIFHVLIICVKSVLSVCIFQLRAEDVLNKQKVLLYSHWVFLRRQAGDNASLGHFMKCLGF